MPFNENNHELSPDSLPTELNESEQQLGNNVLTVIQNLHLISNKSMNYIVTEGFNPPDTISLTGYYRRNFSVLRPGFAVEVKERSSAPFARISRRIILNIDGERENIKDSLRNRRRLKKANIVLNPPIFLAL